MAPGQSMDKTLKDLNLSKEECDKFEKAFKDPEFLKLFYDYAKEVSDPKVKAETDAYLRQIEDEGRAEEVYGKGVQLIFPKEAFVIKTRNKVNAQKVFINVCTSDKVGPPSFSPSTSPDGRQGRSLQLPLSLNRMKTAKDEAGAPAQSWDFVVHPDAVKLAHENKAVRDVIAETAMEHIEAHNKEVKLQRNYKIGSVKYHPTDESSTPSVLTLRGEGAEVVDGRVRPKAQAPVPPMGANLTAVPGPSPSPAPAAPAPAARTGFAFPASKPKAPKVQEVPITDPSKPGYTHPSGAVTPAYEVVHRGELDLAVTWGDAGRNLAVPHYPKELVVRVTLPGVSSAAAVELDVSTKSLGLQVPGSFQLEFDLPYSVDDSRGKAKFDKAKQQLEITLPVLAPPPPPLQNPTASITVLDDEPSPVAPSTSNQLPTSPTSCSAQSIPAPHAGDDDLRRADAVHEQIDASSSACGVTAADVELSENQRKWLELHAQQQAAAAAAHRQQDLAAASTGDAVCSASSEHASEGSMQPAACLTAAERTQLEEKSPDVQTTAAAALRAAGVSVPPDLPSAKIAQEPARPPAPVLKPRLHCSVADELD